MASSAVLAPGIGKSRIGMAICPRMPLSWMHSLAIFGKKYMSEKQVMPPLICSAIARSVPSRTKVSSTHLASAGQMCCSSQAISGRSSARPRNSVIAACP
ncbi:hypothetical protein D3C86_2008590 [compost metagenome]